jgi:hypothetical protein
MKYLIKPAVISSSSFTTKSGAPVKDIRFNTVLNVWLGTVSGMPHAWDSDGKCIDRTRPDLDLF